MNSLLCLHLLLELSEVVGTLLVELQTTLCSRCPSSLGNFGCQLRLIGGSLGFHPPLVFFAIVGPLLVELQTTLLS